MRIEDPEGALGPKSQAPAENQFETEKDRMARLAGEMLRIGVSGNQVRRLLSDHPLDEIERQLGWIDFRSARKKASLLITAIDQGYEAPANLPPYE